MGSNKIYHTDAALDHVVRITDYYLLREITFHISPERVIQSSGWIADVIIVVEIMLLFDKNDIGSSVYLMDGEQTVKRWRQTFFSVWDAEWDEPERSRYPFRAYAYRHANREVAVKWFDRLDELARLWSNDPRAMTKFAPDNELPYFSIPYAGFTLSNLIEQLKYSIVFVLSDENHVLEVDWNEMQQVWVAIDVMALLCEAYSVGPSVTSQRVEIWQRKMIDIWKALLFQDSLEWKEEDELYQGVVARFDQLKALAEKYPPWFA